VYHVFSVLVLSIITSSRQKFVRSFLDSVLNWSPRKGTRAAAKLPADAEDKCEEAFFQLAYIMKWHNVPPKVCTYIGDTTIHTSNLNFVNNSSLLGLIKLDPTSSQAVAPHLLNVDHHKSTSLQRMKNEHSPSLLQAHQMACFYLSSRFGLAHRGNPFHQRKHKAWPKHANMGLTLRLRKVTKKGAISARLRQ
jgi:hypothetical protein